MKKLRHCHPLLSTPLLLIYVSSCHEVCECSNHWNDWQHERNNWSARN